MSQNYNINMKKFNGTDYDSLLPLAYNALNSQQLDGKTFNEIQNLFESQLLYFYSGKYIGTGSYGSSNPTVFTIPFSPSVFFFPALFESTYGIDNLAPIFTESISSEYSRILINQNQQVENYIKTSNNGKTISLYSQTFASYQFNTSAQLYYFVAIGRYDQTTEYIITQSGTWTVPKTGRYMLELYGGGGSTSSVSGGDSYYYSGGSSCQHYASVSLTAGDEIAVTIGTYTSQATGGSTTFRTYTVAGGGKGSSSVGTKAGNYGKNGTKGVKVLTQNSGYLNGAYGMGAYGFAISTNDNNACNGAVYLKYLRT